MSNAKRLFTANFPYETTEDDLRARFSQYGTVVDVRLLQDHETQRPRGCGFVEMDTQEEAESAMAELDGQDFNGRRIHVAPAQERQRH